MRWVGNLVNYTLLSARDNAVLARSGGVLKLFTPGVVDNADRAPSVSALGSGPSKPAVYETHLSAIEANA